MEFDDVLKEIGEFGSYQKRVLFLAVVINVLLACEAYSAVFIFFIPQHRCAIPGFPEDKYDITNDTLLSLLNYTIPLVDGTWSKCDVYSDVNASNVGDVISGERLFVARELNASRSSEKCQRWVFDHSVFDSTIATDMDVVCDDLVFRASSHMTAEVGVMMGTLLSGFIADRFGRKLPFYIGALCILGGGFGIAFAANILTLNICRFLVGFSRIALFSNGLYIALELLGPSKRVLAGIASELFWCVGGFVLLLEAYFIRNWRYLEIALSVPAFGLLAYWCLLPESPRWLAARGRQKEVVAILQKIADNNGTNLPPLDDVSQLIKKEVPVRWRDVFRSREVTCRVLIVFSSVFVITLLFYVLLYNVSNMEGDVYVNFLINMVLETVGLCSPYFMLDRFGRRPTLFCSLLLAGIICLSSAIPAVLDAPGWVVISMSMAGRFFCSLAMASIYILGPEVFPTVLRGSLFGICIFFARLGGVLSPYIADVGLLVGGKMQKVLPLLVIGTPAVIVAIFTLWLPETKGTNLPETMDDVTYSGRRGLCCREVNSTRNTSPAIPTKSASSFNELQSLTANLPDDSNTTCDKNSDTINT